MQKLKGGDLPSRDFTAKVMATFLDVFGTLSKLLTPPPAYTDSEYDGLEYKWTIFTFRPARESLNPISPIPGLTRVHRNPSIQDRSVAFPRSHHICPRLVRWKVDQWKDCQQLVRSSPRTLCRHTSLQACTRSPEGTTYTLTSWPPSSPTQQTAVLHKMATATFSTSPPVDASWHPYTQYLLSDRVTTRSRSSINSFLASTTSTITLPISSRWTSNFTLRPAPRKVSSPSYVKRNSSPSSARDGIW